MIKENELRMIKTNQIFIITLIQGKVLYVGTPHMLKLLVKTNQLYLWHKYTLPCH